MLHTIKSYSSFNRRRYSDPWAVLVKPDGKPDFTRRVATYTGGFHTGDAGYLCIENPTDGAVYMYGQRDYRGNNTETGYVQWKNGSFVSVDKLALVDVLNEHFAKEAQA